MDHQNILFLGCLTLGLAISAFILWGPSPRPRKKKGQVVGLVNLGSTCFLNTLLQALASCAIFLQWLTQRRCEKNSLTSTLSEVLWVLNGEGKCETHAPIEVLTALKRHGWRVPHGEQDAHELFHVILSTLQDENKKINMKACSLSDALPASHSVSQSSDIFDENLDFSYGEIEKNDNIYDKTNNSVKEFVQCAQENKNKAKPDELFSEESSFCDPSLVYKEVADNMSGDNVTPSSTENFYSFRQEDNGMNICEDTGESAFGLELKSENEKKCEEAKNTDNVLKTSQQNVENKSIPYSGCYNKETLHTLQFDALPFQGLLISKLQCSACGYYSSQHYDAFDSLSLPLGNSNYRVLKLQDMLRMFVSTEIVQGIQCEKCFRKTKAFKTMNFAKLPACLCLHIPRTAWQTCLNAPTKRDDFVDFPEYLPMDEYVVSATSKKKVTVKSAAPLKSEMPLPEGMSYKHMYRLKSVVVHLGDVNSGHFLTYRRGALNSLKRHRIGILAGAYKDNQRWYLASDDSVKLATLCEAMQSIAYMLFYEKCTSDMFSVDKDCKTRSESCEHNHNPYEK